MNSFKEPKWEEMDTHDKILALVNDLVSSLLYYDRKDYDQGSGLPLGVIEKTISDGEITIDEMIQEFAKTLHDDLERLANNVI